MFFPELKVLLMVDFNICFYPELIDHQIKSFNPFLTTGLVHPYHLNNPFLVLSISGVFFHFYCILHRSSLKQTRTGSVLLADIP